MKLPTGAAAALLHSAPHSWSSNLSETKRVSYLWLNYLHSILESIYFFTLPCCFSPHQSGDSLLTYQLQLSLHILQDWMVHSGSTQTRSAQLESKTNQTPDYPGPLSSYTMVTAFPHPS